MIASAVTDLPEPLSPTTATVSPLSTAKEMPRTAFTSLAPRPNETCRSRTSRSCSLMPGSLGESLARIKCIPHRFADEDEENEHETRDDEPADSQPRRLEIVLSLQQEITQGRRSRRQTQPEKVQTGQSRHGTRKREWQKG